MNLLEIGKIVRVHGVRGAVKIICYVDQNFSVFKHVFIGQKRVNAVVKNVKSLNNDAYSVTFDIMPDIDTAQKFINQSVYIDRTEYVEFEDKVYLSDLINKPVLNEKGEEIGFMIHIKFLMWKNLLCIIKNLMPLLLMNKNLRM